MGIYFCEFSDGRDLLAIGRRIDTNASVPVYEKTEAGWVALETTFPTCLRFMPWAKKKAEGEIPKALIMEKYGGVIFAGIDKEVQAE